ncbi:MAG: type II CAAX endopeptidase family protein [Candidatus Omnitrophica bacterium]|nr:type II CAAX endopeptidase family protein [Candidatus Omnitrophota bacterium]
MKIKFKDWCTFIILAILCFGLWYKLEYPRFAFVDLSFNKQQALSESENYLKSKGVDTNKYARAVIFDSDERFNRYFQHAAGLKAEEEFIKQHDFDLFRWMVRFFKESQKEEYLVYLSPRTGKVIRFMHLIEDVEPRADLGKEASRQTAESFLRDNFGADLKNYDFHEEKIKRYENRIEYVFSWEKKGVYIPWKAHQGGAKLLTEVTVSGHKIREFYKNKFDLPEGFVRYVEKQFVLGAYLYSIFYIIIFILLAWSVNIVLRRRQDIVPRLTKKWFYYAACFLLVINTADFINNLQNVFMAYPTSARLSSFIGLAFTRWLFNTGFLIIGFIMPGIAGETLCSEVFPEKKYNTFLSYIKSSFFNRTLTRSVILGYLIWVIMLGLQAVVFYNGQKYLGVWREWYTMTYFSSSYVPLFSAFVIGASASLNEEINFRLFGISLAKKYLRNSILAVILASVVWGMGHTMYAIFPVWFRIVEISLIGLFYGFIFIRFGIIPLLVAHYLFDVFLCSAAYLLGKSSLYLFYTSVGLLAIPLFLAILAYFTNKSQIDKPLRNTLDEVQVYNLGVLVTFVSAKRSQGCSIESIKNELIRHNWDHLLVGLAIKEVFKE